MANDGSGLCEVQSSADVYQVRSLASYVDPLFHPVHESPQVNRGEVYGLLPPRLVLEAAPRLLYKLECSTPSYALDW